ncbi:DUF3768 domain-containing protein [Shimia thalassica]|uniref:DUF3768 domain-containing protein n=1 Tax=Shimia thalassica TaxID=1715693 RepID=UPI0026E3DE60|nr:DUF3768 domain-containing protein [Shimia thalassica]MDO6523932.1 DUF3768 domain-containing protein [Shimia thalassica]
MSPRPTLAEINDRFRRGFIGGEVYLTRGIADLPALAQADIIAQVRRFDSFTEDNDPYGEHDFGSLNHSLAGKVFWKIDYYDPDKERGSEDPLDPAKTCRVLTILLAEEW